MKRVASLLMLGLLSASSVSAQQLAVRVEMENPDLLLFEPINVVVSIHNYRGRAIELGSGGQRDWLTFTVSSQDGRAVQRLAQTDLAPALVGAGQTISQTINLLPLFDLRGRGSFEVQASIRSGTTQITSPPVKFTILDLRPFWSQPVILPPTPDGTEETRTYSLYIKHTAPSDLLYAGVSDDDVVYGVMALGRYFAIGEPAVRVDKAGHLHVLHRAGGRTYGYTHIDPRAQVVARALYSDVTSAPRLTESPEGLVAVSGGEKIFPKEERVIDPVELAPPPPPAQGKKGKPTPPPKPANTNATAKTKSPATP